MIFNYLNLVFSLIQSSMGNASDKLPSMRTDKLPKLYLGLLIMINELVISDNLLYELL